MKNSIGRFENCLWIAIFAFGMTNSVSLRATQGQDRISKMQKVIDAADEKIREVTGKLADSKLSSGEIARLNRLRSDQQWVKAQAQAVIVKERERQRKRRQANSETARFRQEIRLYISKLDSFKRDDRNYGAYLRDYNAAIKRFNSAPFSQTEFNRLNTWRENLAFQRDGLKARHRKLEVTRRKLVKWRKEIEALFAAS